MAYEDAVVPTEGTCCPPRRTLQQFCGNGTLLRSNVRSMCTNCGGKASAQVWKSNDTPPRIYMVRDCLDCGPTSSCISTDAQFYFEKVEGAACGCGPGGCGPVPLGENAVRNEQLHACTLVVEIVEHCNFACPTCFADSPHAKQTQRFLSFDDFTTRVLKVLDRQGAIDIMQLSGGEPTLHPELLRIVAWCAQEDRIRSTLLNTNGSLLAQDSFAAELAKHVRPKRFGVYLQYDGAEDAGQVELRGGDFRTIRSRAIAHCAAHAIPVALVMTVSHDNKRSCASALASALTDDNMPWIVYQPEFLSGRNNPEKMLENPVTVADIIHSIAQGGVMPTNSWIPLPCSDPNCGMIGFMVRVMGTWLPASQFVDLAALAPQIANRINVTYDVTSRGCDDYNLTAELAKYGIQEKDLKMVFIKPFMDARSWDARRVASCCTHVLTPEGGVESFCLHYSKRKNG